MACMVCRGKRKKPGLGDERSIARAFRKILKVEVGVLRERENDQAGRAGPGRGRGLSPGVCVWWCPLSAGGQEEP